MNYRRVETAVRKTPQAWMILMILAIPAFLAASQSARAQLSLSGGEREVASYTADDGSTGFVLDQTGPRPLVQFNGSKEVIVLDPTDSAFGGKTFRRDDGADQLSIDSFGTISIVRDGGDVFTTKHETVSPLTLPDVSSSDLKGLAASVSKSLTEDLGSPLSVEVNIESVGKDGAAAAAHQVYVVEEAFHRLASRGFAPGGVVNQVRIEAGDRIASKFDGKTLVLTIAPHLGFGAGFSSFLLAALIGA